jgi:hypothetical protein
MGHGGRFGSGEDVVLSHPYFLKKGPSQTQQHDSKGKDYSDKTDAVKRSMRSAWRGGMTTGVTW